MTTAAQKPLRVFCSYSRRDEEHLNDLRDWLRPLERQGLIEWWHDREISPGWEWEEAIDKHLRTADIVLLLVSPTFMGSEYVYEKEIRVAVEKHERGEARVIPIIVRPADWEWPPLNKLQAIPKDAKPITTWRNQDEAWLDVVRGIRRASEEFATERQERIAKERYRKAVDEAWADKKLSDAEAEQLGGLASELGLATETIADLEREVMDDSKEAILERQERAAREKEHKERLKRLYARARELHRDREWQAVVNVFGQIHAEEPDYPDPEGLQESSREALENARQEDTLRRYREAVERAWTNDELNRHEVRKLEDLANYLQLTPSTATNIEREAMGETIEEFVERQERVARETERPPREYRRRERGHVKWFDAEKGYGFLVRPTGEDLFVHHSNILGDPSSLLPNDEVVYELGRNDRGPSARRVQPPARENRVFVAPTVNEALAKASTTLGQSVNDLSYRVMDLGTAGFLGVGGRDARIIVKIPETARISPEDKSITKELNATDAARQMAQELGVNLRQVQGSGAEGRITVKDVQSAATQQ
jgi:cold shock CspA family protein